MIMRTSITGNDEAEGEHHELLQERLCALELDAIRIRAQSSNFA